MVETLAHSSVPEIIQDASMDSLGFHVLPHPDEFARLARKVGIPEKEIGKMHITLVAGYLDGKEHRLGSTDPRSRDIRLAILGKHWWNRIRLAENAAHEMDHYRLLTTGTMDSARKLRGYLSTSNDVAQINPRDLAGNEAFFRDYYIRAHEVHARETAIEVTLGRRFHLLTYIDKPGASQRLWPFRKRQG